MEGNGSADVTPNDMLKPLSLRLDTSSDLGLEFDVTPSSSFESIGMPVKVMQQSPQSLLASLPDLSIEGSGRMPSFDDLQHLRGLIRSFSGIDINNSVNYPQDILYTLRDGSGLVSKLGDALTESVKYKQGIILLDNENKRLQEALRDA